MKKIESTVLIEVAPNIVWRFLTDPKMMEQWMADKEMDIRVVTDWKVGNPITISGFNHGNFENKGTVLAFKNQEIVSYSHQSSLSHLSDVLENYAIITFQLKKIDQHTRLNLQIENFPTESIYKHLDFYWKVTLNILKSFIENSLAT